MLSRFAIAKLSFSVKLLLVRDNLLYMCICQCHFCRWPSSQRNKFSCFL